MAEAVFQAPKRRARVYESFESPLPIAFSKEDITLQQDNIVYNAEIVNQNVIVRDPDHIQALYGKGYFGKGVLSRSRPDHSISDRWNNLGGQCLPVISSYKYQKHVSLARDALLAQGLEEEVVNQTLKKLTLSVELDLSKSRREEENGIRRGPVSPYRGKEAGPSLVISSDDLCRDQSMDDVCGHKGPSDEGIDLDCPEAKRPKRQGDPLYDPLAKHYAQEPEQVDQNVLAKVKCIRHDDWIVHCGCRLEDNQLKSVLSTKTDPQGCDPYSGYEYVLVEEHEEDEESGDPIQENCSSTNITCKLICRINPFRIIEYLQLSLEEAFFLVYALGCLSVYYNEEPLSVSQAWQMFRSVQPNFETTYMAYHHFRSKGWVPKAGMKYGTDFMLYRKGPPFYHASYSVVVERADESFQGAARRPFSWRSFAALSRITGNVSKELMLCYVITPLDMTEETLSSPECMKRIKVQEVLVSRWISSRERTEQDEI